MINCAYDFEKLELCMGQFDNWCGKLFYWHSAGLGWRYIKDI